MSWRFYLSVERFEILSELGDAIALADLNAEALLVCHIGGKAAEALAPAASNTNKQGIAPGLHQDPMNMAYMQYGIPATPNEPLPCMSGEPLRILNFLVISDSL